VIPLLLLWLAWCSPLAAQAPPLTLQADDPRLQQGIDLIYQLRFAKADHHFERLIAAEPDNPVGHFFLALVGWWRVLVDLDDTSHDEEFYGLLEKCVQVCDQRLTQRPGDFDALMCKGGAIGFRGRLRGDRHDFLQAAADGLRCLPLLDQIRLLDPANKDVLFAGGIYDYFVEAMPERYPVVKPIVWLMRRGDKQRGLEQLRTVAQEGRYARTEAAYFLAQIYRVFEGDDRLAFDYFQQLHARYPGNALFHRHTARAMIALGAWEQGAALYAEVARHSEAGQTGYHRRGHLEAVYYLGRDAFRQRQLELALRNFSAADSLGQGLEKDLHYLALAALNRGMCLDLLGRRPEALAAYRQVKRQPDYRQSHDLADQYLETPYTGGTP
jgi:tetratricopeptide (TPR) repeat protein